MFLTHILLHEQMTLNKVLFLCFATHMNRWDRRKKKIMIKIMQENEKLLKIAYTHIVLLCVCMWRSIHNLFNIFPCHTMTHIHTHILQTKRLKSV